MERTYKEIVRIIKDIGIKSTLDKVPVKVIYMQDGVLVLEPKTGWLALRKAATHENKLSNETKITYYNEVKYKDGNTPYCLFPELLKISDQIMNCK